MKRLIPALVVAFCLIATTAVGQPDLANTGQLSVTGGQLYVTGAATNTGGPAVMLVSGGAVVTFANNFTATGGTISNGGTMQIAGNWQTAGASYGGSGTIEVNGATAQSFNISGTIGNLTINKTGGSIATLASNVLVLTQFQLAGNGLLTTSLSTLLNLSNTATLVGGSNTAYVDGPVRISRNAGAGPAMIFPIGTATGGYSPITLSPANYTAAATVTAEAVTGISFTPTSVSPNLQRLSTVRFWRVAVAAGADLSGGTIQGSFNTTNPIPDNVNNTATPAINAVSLGIKTGGVNATGNYTQMVFAGAGGSLPGNGSITVTSPGLTSSNTYYIITGVNRTVAGTITNPGAVCFGDQASLAVTGDNPGGVGTPTYQWRRNGTDISGATGTGYTTDPLTAGDNFVRVLGNTSNSPSFEPNVTPTFTPTLNPALQVDVRAILQGAYDPNTGLMSSLITPSQFQNYYQVGGAAPYNMNVGAGPYDFATSLVNLPFVDRYPVASPPPPLGTIDAIFIGLRSTLSTVQDTIVNYRKLAWLQPNGSILEFKTAGTSPTPYVSFCIGAGSYYVVVRHRNHLPMITANPVSLAVGANPVVDFTVRTNVRQAIANVQEGGYLFFQTNRLAMFAGKVGERDRTSARFVNAFDYAHVFRANLTIGAFLQQDLNFDNVVNAADLQLIQTNVDNLFLSGVPTW